MGSGAAAGKRGRYEEKGGGRHVGSVFEGGAENEKIKAAYGNYGLWSWLRYRWLDSEWAVELMLADKSWHDYDYTEPKRRRKLTEADREVWDDAKVAAVVGRLIDPSTGRGLAGTAAAAPHFVRGTMDAEGIQLAMRRDLGMGEVTDNS